ncbi:UbiA family prenyltransferase [Nocardioides sp. C4-1]|uniref:UbiA family prenyltransferase n=1 Tax=Nocardioides sp. C4-1 TaxID=3151851 RepID=UPI003267CD37
MTALARDPRARSETRSVLAALAAAAHGGPTVAVTTLAALLAVAADLPVAHGVLVVAAVLAGQLTIGWGNDLLDHGRDVAVGRDDKPLATGVLTPALVGRCLAVAALACVTLSAATGWRAGLVHLGLLVAMGHAYNLGLKATAWSWAPYAVAFGSLPAVITLAGPDPVWAPWWQVAAGAALGVGAHLLNALPDLDDDLSTGVRGLPHRLGARRSRVLAALVLAAASLAAALGPGSPGVVVQVALLAALVLAVVAATTSGRTPFRAAIAVALVDVVLLVVGAR